MIIGISGKISGGKSTLASLIQYIQLQHTYPNVWGGKTFDFFLSKEHTWKSDFDIKRFDDKVEQIVSILTGLELSSLEFQNAKDTVLNKRWNYNSIIEMGYNEFSRQPRTMGNARMTIRDMINTIRDDAMKNIVHPNTWINALFINYRPLDPENSCTDLTSIDYSKCKWPNWIITDVKSQNEAEAIKERRGLLIRINRDYNQRYPDLTNDKLNNLQPGQEYVFEKTDTPENKRICDVHKIITHPSETSLDNYDQFDHIVDNNGTIDDLALITEALLGEIGIIPKQEDKLNLINDNLEIREQSLTTRSWLIKR